MNVLSPNIHIKLRFTKQAFQQLPEVTVDDYRTGREKYRALIGTKELHGSILCLTVHHVYHFEASYIEAPYEIRDIDFTRINNSVGLFSRVLPKFKDMYFIGDIHTHPLLPGECIPFNSWHPSATDTEQVIDMYDSGFFHTSRPFVQGIGGYLPDGKTGYSFYHPKKDSGRYSTIQIDWLPDL